MNLNITGSAIFEHSARLDVTGSEASTIKNLTFAHSGEEYYEGGELKGTGIVDVTGTFVGGGDSTYTGSGALVLKPGATGHFTHISAWSFSLYGSTLRNEGTLTVEEDTGLEGSNKAKLINTGTLIMNDQTPNSNHGLYASSTKGEALLINTGTVEKTEGTSTGYIKFEVQNESEVLTDSGKLIFAKGGPTPESTGTWTAAGTSQIGFNEQLHLGEEATLAGTFEIASGEVTVGKLNASTASLTLTGDDVSEHSARLDVTGAEASTIKNLTFAHSGEEYYEGGELKGTGIVDVTGTFVGGGDSTYTGSGALVLKPGATGHFTHISAWSFSLYGSTLRNEGTLTVEEDTGLEGSNKAKLINTGTLIMNDQTPNSNHGLYASSTKGEALLINTGTVEKTEGTSTGYIKFEVQNESEVLTDSGKLIFAKGGPTPESTGTWTAAGTSQIGFNEQLHLGEEATLAGTFEIASGEVTVGKLNASTASLTLTGDDVSEHSARLDVTGAEASTIKNLTFAHSGEEYYEGGELKGAGTVDVTGTFIGGGYSDYTGSGALVLKPGATGHFTKVSTSSFSLAKSTLRNEGTLTVEEDTGLQGSSKAKLVNTGTLIMNDQTPDSNQGLYASSTKGEALLVNTGTVEKTEGTSTGVIKFEFENLGRIIELTGSLDIEHPVPVEVEKQYGSLNPSEISLLRAICGDPVDCVTGNFYEQQTDIAVSGRGVGLDLTRYYNAQAAAKGEHSAFGYGWSSSFSDHVVYSESAKTATVVQANGSTVTFSEESGSWRSPAWTQDKLTGNSSEGYTLTLADQTVYKFSSAGRLESVADRNGNTTSLSYNEKGQLATITDPSGRTIKLAYNGEGLVESATDPMGHVVKYTYESGSLATVTLPGQSSPRWHFKYDGSHRMTSMVNGISGETTNTYNEANQVISQKDPTGHTLKWVYEPFKTKITNESTSSVTLEQYTTAGKVNAITHGYGTEHATTETFTYNESGEPLTHTDGNEHTTSYEYDSVGNKTKQTGPEGHETKWTYNAEHEITSETLPSGEKTSIEYDEHGNPVKVSRPAPKEETQETRYEYNAHGEMSAMIDPVGGKWTYEYDEAGDRTSETDPEGDKTTWGYNEDSQKTSEVSPAGNVEGGKPGEYTTSIERNTLGQPVKVTKPEGKETVYEYNADGDQTAATDPNGHKTEVSYNSEDKPIKVKQPSGATQETEYNGAGQIVKQTDGNKHATSYVRNVLGQVTEETNPLEHKTKKTYDAAGNLATSTDAAGRTTTYSYNKENQLTKISYSEAGEHTVEYEYTPDGQLSSMSDGTGTTSYTYDQLGRLTETKDGHGDVVGYGYDLANEITSITYPNGKTVKDGYDKAGRLTSVADWLSHTISFSYTPESQLATESLPEATGESDHYTYSRAGELVETKMSKGSETLASILYKRDSLGQLTKATQTGLPGAEATEYAYTTNEQLEKAGSTSYEYDAAGNPTKIGTATNTFNAANQLTEGGGDTYTYNEVGQRTKATPTTGPATTYGYDQAGNLTTIKRPEEGETTKIEDSYTYNGNNLRASEAINGTTHYLTWQLTGALPLLLSDGSNSYIYGPEGAPIEQITTHEGKEEAQYLHHDQQGSTRLLTNEKGETVGSYTYTPYGAVEKHEGVATTALGYDGQLTSSETGLIYLRARTYDPSTAQFLGVDPIDELTRQPYNYALDNPLNLADPSGLCGLLEVSCYVEEGAKEVAKGVEAGAEWVGEHPAEAAGIGLGIVSAATGVGAIADVGLLETVQYGAISAITGAAGTALDAEKCFDTGDTASCVGFGLNGAGAGLGLGATLMDAGFIDASVDLRKLLEYAGVSAAVLGLGVDTLSLPELRELLCE